LPLLKFQPSYFALHTFIAEMSVIFPPYIVQITSTDLVQEL